MLCMGQLEKCQSEMVGIATVSGMNHVIPIVPSNVAMKESRFTLAVYCYIMDAYLPALLLEEEYFRLNRNKKIFCVRFTMRSAMVILNI